MPKSRFDAMELIDDQKRHWVPEPTLLALAEQLCDAYIAQRPQFVPGRVTIPKKDLRKFYDAAVRCRLERLTPEQFIYRQLQAMSLTGNFWPSSIATKRPTEKNHNQLRTETISSYTARLANYQARAMLIDPRLLVDDEQLDMTPLMRFALASELRMTDLMVRYKQAALMEYRSTDVAAELFKGVKEVLGV